MTRTLPPCPFLPLPCAPMNWQALAAHGQDRGPGFYLTALSYGNDLWTRGLAARATLCLDRALGADLSGNEEVLRTWPLPYHAMGWFLREVPPDVFIGNPRVHFQHYAGRMNEPRREQRRWRAWACWHLSRLVLPHLPPDPKHVITEPAPGEIAERLSLFGHPGETELWADACRASQGTSSTATPQMPVST